MSRRRRRQEAEDLVRRLKDLPPEQRGMIMSVLIGNALVSAALQTVLLVVVGREALRTLRARRGGSGAAARTALTRPVVALTCACGLHVVFTQTVLPRWTRRAVRRAADDAEPDDGPSSS